MEEPDFVFFAFFCGQFLVGKAKTGVVVVQMDQKTSHGNHVIAECHPVTRLLFSHEFICVHLCQSVASIRLRH
jgi:hypothetical protein